MAGTLWRSVVAKTHSTYGGGSSMLLSRALKAALESMWTSSTMTTRKRSREGRKRSSSCRSRTSSTPVWVARVEFDRVEAGAISDFAARQAHSPHGSGVGPSAQLTALANRRAAVVLPTPRRPENR